MRRLLVRAAGVIALTLVLALTATTVAAVSGDHRAMVGLATMNVYILPDEINHGNPGYDLQVPGATPAQRATNTTNVNVYSQMQRYSDGTWLADSDDYISGTGCEGTAVNIWNATSGGMEVGRQEYVHIDVREDIPANWSLPAGWTVQLLGPVKGTENVGCSWTTPHLHQSDYTMGAGKVNTDIDQGEQWATGSSSAWLFKYTSP